MENLNIQKEKTCKEASQTEQKIIELENKILDLETQLKETNDKFNSEYIFELFYEYIKWWIKVEDKVRLGVPSDLRPSKYKRANPT